MRSASRPPMEAAGRLGIALGVGAAAGVASSFFDPWQASVLLTWEGAALTWGSLIWSDVSRLNPSETRRFATREDPRRALADSVLLAASVLSIAAELLGIVKAAGSSGSTKALLLGAGVLAIVTSWLVVHTVFTLRYAALYYTGPDGGIDFNEDDEPTYADFAYLAFTIGMTYQVSDTDLTSKPIRHTALRHALLSYLIGTVIIASTINIVAGLAK